MSYLAHFASLTAMAAAATVALELNSQRPIDQVKLTFVDVANLDRRKEDIQWTNSSLTEQTSDKN